MTTILCCIAAAFAGLLVGHRLGFDAGFAFARDTAYRGARR